MLKIINPVKQIILKKSKGCLELVSKPNDYEVCVLNYDSNDEFGLAKVDVSGDEYIEEVWPAIGEDYA